MAKRAEQPAEMTSEALVQSLPGEGALDAGILEQAVATINRIHGGKALEAALGIGNYVLATFFDNDPESFRKREEGHVTFRALANREDLEVSYTTIWNAVAVLDQLRLLPDTIAHALPLSHHKLLLPVKNPDAKVKLAQRAIDKGLSKRKFEDEVKKLRQKEPGASRPGRPPLPDDVKSLTRFARFVTLAAKEKITPSILASYKPDEARKLLSNVQSALERLQLLQEALRTHLEPGSAE